MIHVTCRLTAKNRDQLRNPTLGNRVWSTFLRLQIEAHWPFVFFALYKCTYLLSFVRCSMRFADVISLRAAAWAGRGGASRDRRGGKQRGAAL